MPKTFYTERDIEDLAKRGVISLVEDDDVVLTDLARDKAMCLGIEIVHEFDQPPSAPERPYITEMVSPSATRPGGGSSSKVDSTSKAPASSAATSSDDLYQSVGDAVDPQLLDTIIRRVLQNVGIN